jgi:HK97 family phage major capsid protein
MHMTIKELKEKRAKIAADMQALHALAEKEDRGFSTDEDAKWDQMVQDLDEVDSKIKRAQKLSDLAGNAPVEPTALRAAGRTGEQQVENAEEAEVRRVFDKLLRNGMAELDPEERSLMMRRRDNSNEARAFTAGAGNAGAYTVPQDFRDQLDVALRAFGGMLSAGDMMTTDTGATLPMPTFNYTNVVASIVGEGASGNQDSSTPFGVANLGAWTYRSPILPVSYEFLQDSAFGTQFIVDALSDSIGRAWNAHFTTGTGSGQPRGIMLDAVAGKVGATGQTVSVVFEDLVDLVHSVDPAYRQQSAGFMMHDQSLKIVRKLKDNQGRPIYLPAYDGLGGAMGDQIMGFNVTINQDMPQMGANAKSLLFGALKKYKIRKVRDITLLRLTERYADNLQVAFLMFARADGRLLDAGTNPVKYYQNSAT